MPRVHTDLSTSRRPLASFACAAAILFVGCASPSEPTAPPAATPVPASAPEPTAAPVAEAPAEPAPAVAPEPATAATRPALLEPQTRCDELALAMCDRSPLPCNAFATLLREVDVPHRICSEARPSMATFDDSDTPFLDLVSIQIIVEALLAEGRNKDEDAVRRFLDAPKSDAFSWSFPSVRDPGRQMEQSEACPGTTSLQGTAPPKGTEVFCAREDGTRHGPTITWADGPDPVRIAYYRNGAVASVRYPSGRVDVPPSMFLCPETAKLEASTRAGVQTKRCVRDGEPVGATVSWKGDCLLTKEAGQLFVSKTCP